MKPIIVKGPATPLETARIASAPKKKPCVCGSPSILCVHGADGAWWLCKPCFEQLMKRLQGQS